MGWTEVEHLRQFKNMLNRTNLIKDFGIRSGRLSFQLSDFLRAWPLCAGRMSRGLSLVALTCSPAKTADGTRSAAKLLGISGLDFA